jgi:Metallo-beta-lactamase superfamily
MERLYSLRSKTALLSLAIILYRTIPASSQPVPGSLDVHLNEGASDCNASLQQPLHVHKYGIAHVDLGGRVVDVIPTPGHNETHVAFYDKRTGILFSGDFLLPGRLLIEDSAAYHKSAQRGC